MILDGTGIDFGYGITTDSAGNMYVTGQYTSSTTVQINNLALNSTPQSSGFTLPAASSTAAFVLKYNSSGTLLGSMILDGTGADVGRAITIDSSVNMYVTGQYTSTTTVQINNLALNSTPQSSGYTLPAASATAAFVLKYNSSGTLVGSMILAGTSADAAYGITTDLSGNMYVTGQYISTTTTQINNLALNSTPQPSVYTFPVVSSTAAFVLKYSSSGTLLGSMLLDGSSTDSGQGITTDLSGNMYVTGQYNSSTTTQINNLALNSTPQSSGYTFPLTSSNAAFVLKYNSSGILIGSMILDGTGTDFGYGITTDSSGNMYVTGQYLSTTTVQINNFALNSTPQSSGYTLPLTSSTTAVFVLKYNLLGTLLGSMILDGNANDVGYGITTDLSGNMYVTGQYNSSTTTQINNLALNSTPQSSGYTFPLTSSNAAFVLKYNSSGILIGSMIIDGNSSDVVRAITTDSSGNMYVTGQSISTTTTQINNLALNSTPQSSGYTLPADSTQAAFVLKYGNVQNIQLTLPDARSQTSLSALMLLDGTGTDFGQAITTDSSGNMYVTGYYTSTTTTQINNLALNSNPQPSGYTLPAASTQAVFVLKYNSTGTLVGSMLFDGTGADVGYGITTDSSGNMYVTGQYISTTTTQINNLALNSTPQPSGYTFPAASTQAVFVLKYNSSGTLRGSMLLDGTGADLGYGITVDSTGNMYMTGQYISTTTTQINNLALNSTPQPSGYTFPATTSNAAFVLKYSSAGILLGSMLVDGNGSDTAYGITTDSTGNMYVAGRYSASTTTQINNLALNSTPQSSGYTFPAASTGAGFVLKYNSTGTLVGSMLVDGTGADTAYGITTDSSGNMYVTGRYASTTTTQINNLALNSTQQPSGYTFPAAISPTLNATFVLKYSSSGTLLGSMLLDGTDADYGYGITTDSSGNMYVTGYYTSTTTTQINNLALNSTPQPSGYTLPVSTGSTAVVLKYNFLGTLTGSMILDGTGNDFGYGITIDLYGNMYVTGYYNSTTTTQINNLALNSTPQPSGYTFPASTQAAFVLKYSFPDTTIIQKKIYLQSPGNYYIINKGPTYLTVGPTSNVINTDWTLDRWSYSIQ